MNIYLSLSNNIYYDIRKNFIDKKFCQLIILFKIIIKNIFIKVF